MSVNLGELIHALERYDLSGDVNRIAAGVEYNSQQVNQGSVFVAIPGFQVDGFEFAEDAVKRGACCVVSERDNVRKLPVTWVKTDNCRKALSDLAAKFYNYPGKALKVCGITGTNGKTTSALMLKHALEGRAKKVGLISSLRYDTGEDVFEAERTTPESLDIQRLLFLMRANYCNNV
ncbi:MAG TPA: Mur ligase domain-containing protein, partial [candidate division Zixibacteria bacterium]|nr:Mur ligase domain-containing protein [candidate division Zixibacteria bacterium]